MGPRVVPFDLIAHPRIPVIYLLVPNANLQRHFNVWGLGYEPHPETHVGVDMRSLACFQSPPFEG